MEKRNEQKTDEPVIIERMLNAPINRVWKALTNVDEIRKWSFDVSDFKPEVGFEFSMEGGHDDRKYMHLCRVTEVIPERKLSYTWRYEGYPGDSLVTFELFSEEDKTLVRVTHTGIETIAVNGPDFARENFIEGWTQIVGTSLKEYVEKA